MDEIEFNIGPTYQAHMETGPWFEISSGSPEDREIEVATPGSVFLRRSHYANTTPYSIYNRTSMARTPLGP